MRQTRGGAAPAADLLRNAAQLTRHQRAILDVLIANPEGLDVASLAVETEAHPNTVRGHLSALVERGLVSFQKREDGLKGRPALVYRAASAAPESPARHLVDLLHCVLGATPAGQRDATAYEWGRAWGEYIASNRTVTAGLRETAVTLMTEMGFAPQVAGSRLDLHRCPLMRDKSDVMLGICRIHQGMLDKLAEKAGGGESVAVVPAASPTSCQLQFGAAG